MATNKRVGRGNDPKPGRSWIAIGYPESLAADWLEQLQDMLVSGAVSPLHDQDVYTEQDEQTASKAQREREEYPVIAGKPKKPHYHILLTFTSDKSYKQVKDIFDDIGAVAIQRVGDRNAVIRYFCHLDSPSKHQYSVDNIVLLGAYDPGEALAPKWLQARSVWRAISDLSEHHTYYHEFLAEVRMNEQMYDYASNNIARMNMLRWAIEDRRKKNYHMSLAAAEELEHLRRRDNEKDEPRYVIDEATGELYERIDVEETLAELGEQNDAE